MKQYKALDDVEILKRAKWNKDTSCLEQITFTGPDGYLIHVVRSTPEWQTRKQAEALLIEKVKEHYGW